ncbi:hypothetical protein CMK14_20325 [Candidatus Poribacteria bacterium]|nr:hypothetical protein [Candidatus Poribacteria bacterium]
MLSGKARTEKTSNEARNTQRMKRRKLNFRTRIKQLSRRTTCLSKPKLMQDRVIG